MRYFGIDIGGTKIKYALFDDNLDIIDRGECDSHASLGKERLLTCVTELLDKYEFDALGVSTAGIVGQRGEIVYANENISNYTGTELGEILRKRYGVKTGVLNDIDAAAICEYYESRSDDFYFIALGTGVGGAYVRRGEIIKGGAHFAGQVGYLTLDGGECVDLAVSTRGLSSMAGVDAREVFGRAKGNDATALGVIKKWVHGISSLIKLAVAFFSPREIVLGGGVSMQGDYLLDMIRDATSDFPVPYKNSFTVRTATLGNYSAAKGAVIYTKTIEKETRV